jgi:CHAD domain-containing protein
MSEPVETATEDLKSLVVPVLPEDTMSEAARKALLKDYIRMLDSEEGSRTGGSAKPVHNMRVATRRMRTTLQLLSDYFKTKTITPFEESLKTVARALGDVRDIDVMIEHLETFRATLPEEDQTLLEKPISILSERRDKGRKKLNAALDKKDYAHFVANFGDFVTNPGSGARSLPVGDGVATQARYLLPVAAYEHLAIIRAYDAVLNDASDETLHQLRIEFKRLRYLLTIFEEILGKAGKDFIDEIKVVQDHLGGLQDTVVAQTQLRELLPKLGETEATVLELYINAQTSEHANLRATFPDVWRRFNTRTVQRQLASAIAGL